MESGTTRAHQPSVLAPTPERVSELERLAGGDSDLEAVRSECERLLPSAPPELRDRLRFVHALALAKTGRWKEADDALEPLLQGDAESGDPRRRAEMLNLSGIIQRHRGDREAAYAAFREAQRAWEAVEDATGLAKALINQANLHSDSGDYGSGVALQERALDALSPERDPNLFARVLLNVASDHHTLGNLEVALELCGRAATLVEAEPAGARLRAEYRLLLGLIRLGQNAPQKARVDFDEALRLASATGDRHLGSLARLGIGRALLAENLLPAARRAFDEAEEDLMETGNRRERLRLLLSRAEWAVANGDLSDARVRLQDLISQAEALNHLEAVHSAQRKLAEVEEADGRPSVALAWLKAAMEVSGRSDQDRVRRQMNLLRLRLESMQERHARELERSERNTLARHNAELEKANERLERLVFERRELLAIVAHDLRSPLATVISGAEVAASDPELSASELRELMMNLGQTAEGALELLGHLLSIERMDSALVSTRSTLVEITSLLESEIVRVLSAARQKQIQITAVAEKADLALQTDPLILSQILHNFLTNAVKYAPHGSRIQVFARTAGAAGAEIAVGDEGPGIPEEMRAHLFTRFFKAGSVPTGGESSTGLGLYLVRRYADLIGGRVGFRPREPQGSVFYLQLDPAASPPSD